MKSAMQAHRRMKDSGVGWIGDVPEHWDIAPTKFVARLESGHTPSRQHPEYWVDCSIPWFSLADVWQLRDEKTEYLGETKEMVNEQGIANSGARLLPSGTVIVSRTASVGYSGIMPRPMATTQDFVNWVCGPTIRPEYLLYVFRGMKEEFKRLKMGSTHQTIYMPDVETFRTPVPPLDEQDRVVRFLRRRLGVVNALIEKKQRLIALLEEKRQAVISRAVTKGLDPGVRMKDSGVPWLGEIPAHWEQLKLSHLLVDGPRNGTSPAVTVDGGGVKSFSISVVRDGDIRVEEADVKWVDAGPAELRQYSVSEGDILVIRGNGNIHLVGRCGVVREDLLDFVYPDILMKMRPSSRMPVEYLALCINVPVRMTPC